MIPAHRRGTVAIVDLDAIRANVVHLRQVLEPGGTLMAVVKADAYGHGAVPVARVVLGAGATWLGVATAEEGMALRRAGLAAPILVLGASNPAQADLALQYDLDVTVFEESAWQGVIKAGRAHGHRPKVHLKIDTGMGRVGIAPDDLGLWADRIRRAPVIWQGLMSHLACADTDAEYTRFQLAQFLDAIEQLRVRLGWIPPWLHLANSAATLQYPGTHFSLARVGLGLYGAKPYPDANGLKPALALESRVTFVKRVPKGRSIGYGRTYITKAEASIATIAIGYADGFRRAFSNRGAVLIAGCQCPVVGRVSMDQITVLVPSGVQVAPGDRVVLIGNDGTNAVTVEDWAGWAETISYEVLTGISGRVPRVYRINGEEIDENGINDRLLSR